MSTLNDPPATANDHFGYAVAVSRTTVVVGAFLTNNEGAAYIYLRAASVWPTTPTATLADPATTAGDRFGWSVAVSGQTAVIGAFGTSSFAGAAYIYKA
jgi:hypothetical protein